MNVAHVIVVWELSSCEPGNFYDRGAVFDDYDEMLRAMRKELDGGRMVMIERRKLPVDEWRALPELPEGELEQVPPIRADEA